MLDRTEALTLLAKRFPGANAADKAAEKQRIGFLVEDTSGLPIGVLRNAIRDGVKVWRFMPTAAEIFEQAKDALAERRSDARIAALLATPAPALPAPEPENASEARAKFIAETFAKIDAGTAKMLGTKAGAHDETVTERWQRENGGALLPQTIALREKMMGY